jgi:hypothetical protein
MQKVIRSYVFDGESLDKLQETLDEGYVVVMANKVGKCDDAIEYILEKKGKEISIDTIVKGLRVYASTKTDLFKAGVLQAAKLIETGEIK